MQIWIDNTQQSDATDLGDALEQARIHAESSGRLIIDILVDGQPATDELFEDQPEGLETINELRFTTADTSALISETAHTAIESIELLKADQEAGAQQIRAGELEDAMQTLQAIMEGWLAMRDVVDQIAQIAQIDIATVNVGDEIGSDIVQSLSNALAEVRETLQNEDWSSLGDVIEYDLSELAGKWANLLQSLIQSVQTS